MEVSLSFTVIASHFDPFKLVKFEIYVLQLSNVVFFKGMPNWGSLGAYLIMRKQNFWAASNLTHGDIVKNAI